MPKKGRIYVNQSVSFPPQLLAAAKKRAKNLGLSFSTYVQKCLERDLAERPAIIFAERGDDDLLGGHRGQHRLFAGGLGPGVARR